MGGGLREGKGGGLRVQKWREGYWWEKGRVKGGKMGVKVEERGEG